MATLVRWIIAFFTRPIQVRDLSAFWRPLGGMRARSKLPAARDFEETQIARRPAEAYDRWRDLQSNVDVDEQPIDTLPADLQDELTKKPPAA